MNRFSAGDQVLQNPDLVHQILEHVSPNYYDDNRHCLCDAALVCRLFSQHAQDILWEEIQSIIPLFNFLPGFQYSDVEGAWNLTEPLSDEDVIRLKRFGRRIRHVVLELDEEDFSIIAPSTLVMIAFALGGDLLLPNLQGLNLLIFESEGLSRRGRDMSFLPFLYSTRLKSVTINLFFAAVENKPRDTIAAFLHRLQNSSQLQHLDITHVPVHKAILKAVSTLRSLRFLRISLGDDTSLKTAFLAGISTLGSLEYLEISWSKGIDLPPNGPKFLFHSLRQLDITRAHVNHAAILFAAIQAPCIERLDCRFIIQNSPLPHDYHWPGLFDSVKEAFPSLFELSLNFSGYAADPAFKALKRSYTGVRFAQISNSLLALPLTHITISFPLFKTLRTEELEQMAEAWPTMNHLSIESASKAVALKTPSLVVIAERWPSLGNLSLSMDMADIASPSDMDDCHDHELKCLTIHVINWGGTPREVAKVASLIDSLFPSLDEVMLYSKSTSKLLRDACDGIKEYRNGLQAARARGRHAVLKEQNGITQVPMS